MEGNKRQEQRAYQLGEHQLHERKGFNARNLAEAMDAMRTILTEKDEKRGVTYIMAEEAEFIALCLAVRFATDFDGDPDALYRLVRSEPAGRRFRDQKAGRTAQQRGRCDSPDNGRIDWRRSGH